MKPLNIALIGIGAMGSRWAEAIHAFRGGRLVAAVDVVRERREKAAARFGALPFTSTEELLASKNVTVDAAVIAVPHDALSFIARTAFAAEFHVLLEKPGGRTVRELAGVVSLAKRKKRVFMMGYNYRYFPGLLTAKKIVDSGKIGAVTFIRARHGFGGRKGYERTWRHDKKISGGGHLIDQGVHLVDLSRWFLGEIARARGLTARSFWKSDVEDNAFLILKHKDGALSSLHISLTQWDPLFSFEVYGTSGYVKVEGLGRKYGGTERVIIGGRANDFTAGRERTIECNPDADKALVRELEEFAAAIREERAPRPSGEDGLATLRIIELIYKENRL